MSLRKSCYKTSHSYYKPVIQQARAILTMSFQKSNSDLEGTNSKYNYTIPYAINMETLFEYYARAELKQAFEGTAYRVESYSKRYFLQKDKNSIDDIEKNIHLMPFCIPDIVLYEGDRAVAVVDAKYKPSNRPDRNDSHQLLAYVLLTGVERCAFILPGKTTKVREMKTSGAEYLSLSAEPVRYYELLLSGDGKCGDLKKILM